MPGTLAVRIFALFWLAGASILPSSQSPRLPEGMLYEALVEEGPLRLHWLHLDPRRLEVSLVRALNDGVGREKVSSIARRVGATGAFNAGFFVASDRYDGDPAGILKIGDAWFSTYSRKRGALGWKADGSQTLIGEIAALCRLRLGNRNLPLNGVNRERGVSEAILYSWAFHRSTLTDPGGVEIAIKDEKVVAVSRSGDAEIPEDGYVASFGPESGFDPAGVESGSPAVAFFRIQTFDGSPPATWEAMDYIVSGSPVLLPRSTVEKIESGGESTEKRAPRTALGFRPDGSWVVLVADGRQPGVSQGMTLPEVAQAMKSRGCVKAINLDGGGSTTLYLDGRVVNSPSDFGVERPVSDAIIVRPRRSLD